MSLTPLISTLTCQPRAKRARSEPCLEEEYRSALRAATGALEAIGSLLRRSPAPDWLPQEMQLLQEKMRELRLHGLSGDQTDHSTA